MKLSDLFLEFNRCDPYSEVFLKVNSKGELVLVARGRELRQPVEVILADDVSRIPGTRG